MTSSILDLSAVRQPAPTILSGNAGPTRYCAVACYYNGRQAPVWLHDKGKIIVFEIKAQAEDILELMADGRDTIWDAKMESCCYQPLLGIGHCNRAVIITDYDIYNLPAQHAVRSETRGKAWTGHVLVGHWLRDLTGVS